MKTAIQIDVENNQVSTVQTEGEWTDEAINEQIDAVGGELAKNSIGGSGDILVVGDFINHTTAGAACESNGFNLFGNTYYGDGLILGGERGELEKPKTTVKEVAAAVEYVKRAGSGPMVEF